MPRIDSIVEIVAFLKVVDDEYPHNGLRLSFAIDSCGYLEVINLPT